jgi:CO/xanthine dehydrogenase Mo-binding subunit
MSRPGSRHSSRSVKTGPVPPSPIGEAVARRDGIAKVTGSAQFTTDISLAGMAYAAIVRSPYPHALVRGVDRSEAENVSGVAAIVTAADLRATTSVHARSTGGVNLVYGHAIADHPMIADGRVRFAGEPVVAVVADDIFAAREGAELVRVDYEPLPFVIETEEALADEAPVVHAEPGRERPHRGFEESIRRDHPNICSSSRHGWGDLEGIFESAHLVLEGEYRYPMSYAYAMEPYTTVASWDEAGLTVWTSAQHPYMVREDLAHCFSLPLSAVRVVVPYVGGGYGSKSYTKIEPLVAALALKAGRPVKLALSVEESILTTRGDSAKVRLRSAFDAGGYLLAREAEIFLNSGAYAENSPLVARKAANRLAGPYRIPALRVDSHSVYTNTAPASSFRGFGTPQGVFAGESQMDEAAERLGLDPLELRRRNLLLPGERPWATVRPLDADLIDDLRLAAEELDWTAAPEPGHGKSICISMSDPQAEPTSIALLRVHADGSATVQCGTTEIGQGSSSVLAQIAAGELGLPLDKVRLLASDTAAVAYDRSTGASRSTTIMGLAIQRAAADLKDQLCGWAVETLAAGQPADLVEGGIRIGDTTHDWGAVVRAWFGGPSGEVVGRGYVRKSGATKEMPPFYEIGCTGVEVSVDEETGVLRVERLVTVGDVGCAINPQLVEAQDLGAAMMGIGMATTEELIYQGGNLINGNMLEYRVPRTVDLPDYASILAERGDGIGPYGAKGGGEGAMNPVAAALANALYRAAGVRVRQAPLTPERIWRAIQERDAADAHGSDAGSPPAS